MYDPVAEDWVGIAGVLGRLTGIDLFRNNFLHEREHVRQVRRADREVGAPTPMTDAGTCWQNGWSWGMPNHNHWRLAPGIFPGGGICTPAGPGTMGAAGSGDVLLNAVIPSMPGYNSWPASWPVPAGAAPGGGFVGGYPTEQECYQQMTGREHALARWDWGNPGKIHRTRNKWDD